MPANSFSDDDQPYPTPTPGFNPGGDDFGVIRIVDGHKPWQGGIEGSNVHRPTGVDLSDVEQGLPVTEVGEAGDD